MTTIEGTGHVDGGTLLKRFRPVFERIREGASVRESERVLPFEQISWLREAGFGAVRVPVEYGGAGATAVELFELLIELARADSNVAHIWRGHFAFLEVRLASPDLEYRRHWGEQAVAGIVVGNAQSETGTSSWTESKTVLRDGEGGQLLLDGEKYYSTGTIFSDWANVTARYGDAHATIAVPLEAAGVERLDDWDGFGQRLTGTGTTRFDGVVVDRGHLTVYPKDAREPVYTAGFYQLFLLAVLAGIGLAAVDDAVEYVRGRTRAPLGSGSAPQEDPLTQSVLGRVSSAAFVAEAAVLRAATAIDLAAAAKLAGVTDSAPYEASDVAAFKAQVSVIPLVLSVTADIFDVGGASSTSRARNLDRHWRNARTIATHNPITARQRAIGHAEIFGELPERPSRSVSAEPSLADHPAVAASADAKSAADAVDGEPGRPTTTGGAAGRAG